ncbi:hypothetical protein ACP70R_009261 [Stipagrostis hirtigluma subsp. patula]
MDDPKNTGGGSPLASFTNSAGNLCRTPFADLTNIASTGATQIIDPKERKRQRDRERYAKMTDEEKSQQNKKQREARQAKKAQQKLKADGTDNDSIGSLRNIGTAGSNDWLHSNSDYVSKQLDQENMNQGVNECTTQVDDIAGHSVIVNLTETMTDRIIDRNERRRQYDRERYAKMSTEEREERNRKQRESRQRRKEDNGCAQNVESINPTAGADWLHRNDTYQRTVHQTRVRVQRHREKKWNTLNHISLAMESPQYSPEPVWDG